MCRFAYDGDGVRRNRLDENGTIHYLGGYERNLGNGAETTEVISTYYTASLGATKRLIAFRRAGTFHYVGTDHLGGRIRVADSGFIAVAEKRYRPFGAGRDTATTLHTDRRFTGQTEDLSSGLSWYAWRAYHPAIGRFTVPDMIVSEPINSQASVKYRRASALARGRQAATWIVIACGRSVSSGIGSPSFSAASIHPMMASFARSMHSSTVCPWVKQPGNAGTETL
jgi:RHS repeat-associated protein